MKKKLPAFLSFLLLATLLTLSPVLAAEFKLLSIGTLDVSDALYSHMWYTGNQPIFSGTGNNGATVEITLDNNPYSTTVDSNEQWSWTPPEALENADHSLSFVSEGNTISLTLTTGSNVPADLDSQQATEEPTLPQAGFATPTLLLLTSSSFLFSLPLIKKKMKI